MRKENFPCTGFGHQLQSVAHHLRRLFRILASSGAILAQLLSLIPGPDLGVRRLLPS